MNAQEAVRAAKNFVSEMFAEEGLTNLGLEEIELEEQTGTWQVTLGFSRPWNTQRNDLASLAGLAAAERSYKSIRIDAENGTILSVRNRETAA